jgi:hypothetical protein
MTWAMLTNGQAMPYANVGLNIKLNILVATIGRLYKQSQFLK